MCDTAFDLLLGMPELAGLPLTTLDIAAAGVVSEQEFDALGPRLPVLALNLGATNESVQTLDWPFTAHQVAQLLGR